MGVILWIPFFLIRFGLLFRLDREAVKRAAHFAPMAGKEKAAYWVYQLSNAAILLCTSLARIPRTPLGLFWAGLGVYGAGLFLLAASMVDFAAPADNGFHQNGLYRLSRNPMYVSYLICFMGCVLLTRSLVLLVLVLVFQISSHWIILAEERWCAQSFGEAYLAYRKKVRRYI